MMIEFILTGSPGPDFDCDYMCTIGERAIFGRVVRVIDDGAVLAYDPDTYEFSRVHELSDDYVFRARALAAMIQSGEAAIDESGWVRT